MWRKQLIWLGTRQQLEKLPTGDVQLLSASIRPQSVVCDLRVTLDITWLDITDDDWSRHDCLSCWLLPAAPTTSHHPATDADSRSDTCPSLHQLSAKLLQFVALWNCRQSTKATTVRPECGSTSDHWHVVYRAHHASSAVTSLASGYQSRNGFCSSWRFWSTSASCLAGWWLPPDPPPPVQS